MSPSRFSPDLRRLTSEAGLVALGQLASFAYPLVSIPLLGRVLGVSGLGTVLVVLAVVQILIVVTDFGFGLSALRRTAIASSRSERQEVLSATLLAKLLLWCCSSLVLLALIVSVPSLREHLVLYLVGIASALGTVFYPMWFVQGLGRLTLLALLTAGSRLLALLGLWLTVRSENEIELAVFWQYAPFLISAIVTWILLIRQEGMRFRLGAFSAARAAIVESVPLFIGVVGSTIIVNSSAIVLSQVSTYRQAGFFGAADRMANAIRGVLTAVQQAMLPRISAAHLNRTGHDTRKLILFGLMSAFAAAGVALALAAPVIVPWYLGDAFEEAIPVVRLMGLAAAISGVGTTLIINLLGAGRSAVCSKVTVAAAGWHLVAVTLASRDYGAVGAAAALCTTELLMAIALALVSLQGRSAARPERPRTA